jgi:hypothetical protein
VIIPAKSGGRMNSKQGVVDQIIVQQVLMHRSPIGVASISGACRALAADYGVTPETMRTYAHKGVPGKSKIAKRILMEFSEVEASQQSTVVKVSASKENLLKSIEEITHAFESSAETLRALRKTVAEETGVSK